MTWGDIVFAVLATAFAGYMVLSTEWRDRQMGILISMHQAIHERLAKIEGAFEQANQTAEKIELHTRRAAQPHYDQDKWDRENPSF